MTAENEVHEDFNEPVIEGTATFSVYRWLKGEGPATIKVDSFGYGPDCRPVLTPDTRVILFLGSPLGEDHYSLLPTWYSEQIAPPGAYETIVRTVGRPPIIVNPDITVSATPTITATKEGVANQTVPATKTPTATPTQEGNTAVPVERGEPEENGRFGSRAFTWVALGGGIVLLGLISILMRSDIRKM